ncbi:DEAD/DEAH box helicase [Pseudonocardia sp. C8]|nr:DEAD/DEAH box helicase [Pseudonocardia sp. C8]
MIVEGLDVGGLEATVDPRTHDRGVELARRGAVRDVAWNRATASLTALVHDDTGDFATTLVLVRGRRGRFVVGFGDCPCPVGFNCRHIVAVALTAAGLAAPASEETPPGTDWEQGLGALIGPVGAGAPADEGGVPLAIELSVSLSAAGALRYGRPAAPRLLARLVRPGRNGWVGGNLSWGRLETPWMLGDARPAHVRLLRELYGLYRADPLPGSYARDDKTIDLAACASRRLWSLLDEAADAGVELVHQRKRLGAVTRDRSAGLRLDVTAGTEPGSLVIAARLATEEITDPVPVTFLGAEAHGVVYVSRRDQAGEPDPSRWRLRLAELTPSVPAALRAMALQGSTLLVPPGQHERLAREYYPRLRRLALVESSDGAFVPPTISGPTLVLHAEFGDEHDVTLDWEWAYEVAGEPVRAPLAPPGDDDAFRDAAGERALLDRLDVPLERLGLTRATGRATRQRLTGMATVRFSTEVLPLLADVPGVQVECIGEPADYREAGDSVRIGVSTRSLSGDTDWFDLGVTITVEGTEVPFATVFGALAAGEEYLLLPDGAWFSLLKPELQALRALIEEARQLQDRTGDGLRISRFQAGLWEELAALGVIDHQARAWQEQVSGLLALDGSRGTPLPEGLTGQLRPYQRSGFGWLAFLWRHRLGGILADDMGLGKTLQTLALICHATEADPALPPFLIVAPTSVVANWAGEAARFAPGLSVVTLTDTLRRRGQDLADAIGDADVVITSYTLFRIDADAHAAARWAGLVLDEAQFAKNHQSKVHQCARKLPAPFKLAITGTPMENNLMELWSLLSITAPGLFPYPARFKETYVRPIERQHDVELLARLRRRVRPLILRRTKDQVAADLPPKQVQRVEIDLDPAHRRIYQRHLQRERQKVLGLLSDVDRNRFTILQSLTLLRQLSLHPGLTDPEHADAGSSKIDALVAQLAEVSQGGHRALVFSQFTGFLTLVKARLDAEGIVHAYLDGSTRDREAAVRSFTDGTAPVFLISLKAGGFGLNLTEADYCFLLDPWWNPAAEAQAIDRAHRIGQTRTVMVYRMIARDTIEEKVAALAERKAELFRGVMDAGDLFSAPLGADDIRTLLE